MQIKLELHVVCWLELLSLGLLLL
jgi:hypothetical protein